MDMTKESLTEMGLTDEQADKVLTAHADSINGKFIPKSRFDEVNTQLKDVKEQVTDRDTQIASLKKFKGSEEELKAKVTELQQDNAKATEEYESKLATVQKTYAVRNAIGSDAQDPDLMLKLIDLDSVSTTNDGKVVGVKEQIDALRKDKPYLFKTSNDAGGDGGAGGDAQGADAGAKGGVRGFKPPESALSSLGTKSFDPAKFGEKLAESRNTGIAAANEAASYYFHTGSTQAKAPSSVTAAQ